MSPLHPARILTSSLVLVVALAACGSSASPSPSSVPSTGPAASGSAAPSASAAPSGSAPAPSGAAVSPAPSVDLHGAPALEARLPKEIGKTPLSAVSLTGDAFFTTGSAASQGQLRDMLAQLGKTTSDLSVAEAHDPTGKLVFQLGLFRVAGADPGALEAAWVAGQQGADANRLQVTTETIGGRTVTKLTDPTRPVGGSTYVVAVGDTLVLVLADDHALVEEALATFA